MSTFCFRHPSTTCTRSSWTTAAGLVWNLISESLQKKWMSWPCWSAWEKESPCCPSFPISVNAMRALLRFRSRTSAVSARFIFRPTVTCIRQNWQRNSSSSVFNISNRKSRKLQCFNTWTRCLFLYFIILHYNCKIRFSIWIISILLWLNIMIYLKYHWQNQITHI